MKDEIIKHIGKGLRTRRNDLGMSLDEISLLTGISKPALSVLENGGGNPTLKTIGKVCKALGLQLELKKLPYEGLSQTGSPDKA